MALKVCVLYVSFHIIDYMSIIGLYSQQYILHVVSMSKEIIHMGHALIISYN